MKKCLILLLMLFLTGCSRTEPTFETVGEVPAQGPEPEAQQIALLLPEEAVEPVQEGNTTYYQCNGYTLTLQTLEGGDLNRTLKTVTGYEKGELNLLQTEDGPVKSYYCVWTSAGDPELQVGRTRILDDGKFHYAVTTMAQEDKAGQMREAWQEIFSSVSLADPDVKLNTGS